MLNAAAALLNSLGGNWRSFVARISCRAMSTAELTRGRGATLEGSAFGRLLKEWRGRRGISQLGLALAAQTTQRHVSFIESGRATPSRDMVLRLGATMALPLRQQNALLVAAGYAPAWQERDLSMPDLAAINSALDYMLSHHEPYPAFVVDRCWNLLRANRGASSLTEFLLGPAPAETPPASVNLAIALVSPDGLRPYIVNRQEVVRYFVRGVQADANADGTSATAHLLERLLFVAGVAGLPETMPPEADRAPVLPIHFRRGDTSLRLFTTIATLGTPRDVTLEEIRIEFFFPIDDATAQAFGRWAEG